MRKIIDKKQEDRETNKTKEKREAQKMCDLTHLLGFDELTLTFSLSL
jgi:hypothetical protein